MCNRTRFSARFLALGALALTTGPAFAFLSPNVPEPSILSMLGLAGVIVAVVAIRRRKK